MASAWQGAGRAKQDTDAFLEAFKRGMPAAELQRLMRGGPLPPPPPLPRRNHRRRARSARAARETRRERDEGRERELEIEKRFKTLEHEVFVAAKAREKSMRRRVDTIGSVASGLREELAEQQARVSKVEEGQRMQKRAETTAASLARALKGRLDELALRVAEQDENAQAQNSRLRERFAELQQQHARLGREQQELASSVAGLRVAGLRALAQSTPAVEGAGAVDYMAHNPMIASCASSPLPLPTAAESSIAPLTRSAQLARLASAVLEPPVRSAPASARPYSAAATATTATTVNAAAAAAAVTAPARARAQAAIAPPPPPSPPRVLITRERCDAFLARHEQTCAAARPYVRTLCETVSAFKSSLRRAAPSAPTAASKTWPRSVPTPRAPAPPPPPRPTARPKGASKHEGRQARQRVRLADPEAEAASRKGVALGVGPRTATSAVAYDDDDDDGQPAMTPLAAAAERLRQQRGRRGARVDDDDDDDHGGVYFGSRDNGARRYRSWLER